MECGNHNASDHFLLCPQTKSQSSNIKRENKKILSETKKSMLHQVKTGDVSIANSSYLHGLSVSLKN